MTRQDPGYWLDKDDRIISITVRVEVDNYRLMSRQQRLPDLPIRSKGIIFWTAIQSDM
jgi:hypothetical protein